jgi:hypothetical protein
VKLALHKISKVLESEPTQINRIIFVAAKALPLSVLVDALNAINAAAGAAAPTLAQSLQSIRDIQLTLTGKIFEHNVWQDADDTLWALERLFFYPPDQVFSDFGEIWPTTRTKYEVLVSAETDGRLPNQVRTYATQINGELLNLDQKKSAAPNVPVDVSRLREFFDNYKTAVRLLYLAVDRSLQKDCRELIRLRDPIEEILMLVKPA